MRWGRGARAELSLQQKLRADVQLRMEELEESVLEKDQELLRLTQIVSRLQGEVSYKLSDKEQTLEEEIQLRERIQLQCKQAERTVEDLRAGAKTLGQSRDELSKQLKLAQEKIIDLEADLEELQENEQRWASKHKRALDQSEQMQMKLIQEKDLNDQLECEKAILERQLRDLRREMEELQNNRVEVDSITRAEIKAKELENTLRAEERSKVVMSNTISKLEKKIHELTEQMEEEHKISTEQRELMNQRIRSLKRQLNEAEEVASRRDVQHRHTQRELMEERETNSRLQRQLLDQQLHNKRKESRQTLESLKLNLSEDDVDDDEEEKQQSESKPTEKQITQV
ncbi:cingulin [Cyprinus carpio]|uniref:Cingulin n=1 Tax=Cyprinus carpio TaxID=7962 RepID=A0A9R0AM14_CYPCA|nr:cingulin [Cyprinus carpio]